jgi:hypothetical protein
MVVGLLSATGESYCILGGPGITASSINFSSPAVDMTESQIRGCSFLKSGGRIPTKK